MLPTFEQIENDIVKVSPHIPFVFIHRKDFRIFVIVDKVVIRLGTIYRDGPSYDYLCESFDSCCFRMAIHRIIGQLFIENPRPDLFDRMDHIDRDTKNNSMDNLRWVNQKLNCINTSHTNVRSRVYFRKNGKKSSYWKKSLGEYAYEYSDNMNGDPVKVRIHFDNYAEAFTYARRDKVRRFDILYNHYINEGYSNEGEGETHRTPLPRVYESPDRSSLPNPRVCRYA